MKKSDIQENDRDTASLSEHEKLRMFSAPQMSSLDREAQGLPESPERMGTKLDETTLKSKDVECETCDKDVSCDKEKCVVEVTNISPKVLEKDVRQLFECCGEIIECDITNNESTNRFLPDDSTQTARLTFATVEAADVAELLSGALLCGQSVRVQRLQPHVSEEHHESEQPTEKQWGYIRSLGQMTGQGYAIGQKAINYLVWFDDKYQISKSLGDKAHELDERAGLTSSLSSVINSAKQRWHEVEQTHPNVVKAEEILSSGLSVASEKVSATAEMLKNTAIASKGSEVIGATAERLKNTTIASKGSEVIGEFTAAIQENIGSGDVSEQQQQDKDIAPKDDESKDIPKDSLKQDFGLSKDVKASKDLSSQVEKTPGEERLHDPNIQMSRDQSGDVSKTQQQQESQLKHSELLGQGGREGSGL
jgi:RNA recognition motif-containing protein